MTDNKQKLYATAQIWKRSLLYVCLLFVFATGLIVYFYTHNIGFVADFNWFSYSFFFLFALYADFKGFPHPNFGYVSFDRVLQVSSILVLGPIPAAIINGLASFLFPMLSNYLGSDKKAITIAVINNSAMMVLMMLLPATLFEYLGGNIVLLTLDFKQFGLLCFLLLSIQLVNSMCMRVLIHVRQQKIKSYFSLFTTIIEFSSGFVGIFFALVYNRMDLATNILFILILIVVITVINQFALMRDQLEHKVKDRTKDLENKTKQLEFLALHDELTGLVNRRYINNHIKCLLEKQTIDNKGIYIAFADIDDFKQINDNYSHDVGDEVLIQIGEVLQQFSNEMLIIARYGGEEFLLCFDSTTKEAAIETCEKIRVAIKNLNFDHINQNLNITVSIGVVNANKHSLHKTLISRADENLYQAKANGKDQIIYSD